MYKEKIIVVPVTIITDGEIIPITDKRIEFIEDDYFGDHLKFDKLDYLNIEDGIFNLETKKYSLGIEVDYYPQPKYSVGDNVFIKEPGNVLLPVIIESIKYDDPRTSTFKGDELSHIKKDNNDNDIDLTKMYIVKTWNLNYVFTNGKTCGFSCGIYKIKGQ